MPHCWTLNDCIEGGYTLGLTGMVMMARGWSCVASWSDCAAGSAVRASGSEAGPTACVFETPAAAAAASRLLSVSCNLATNSSRSPASVASLSTSGLVRRVLYR